MSDDAFVPYDEFPKPHTGSFLTAKEIESFKDAFKNVVRIVRCKDCKYHDEEKGKNFCDCGNRPDDWFCADGKRR